MKIVYKTGDMFAGPETIYIHGCNAQGRMRSGVAKAVRYGFPEAHDAYMAEYAAGGLTLGTIIWATSKDRIIGNAITQDRYGYDGGQYVSYDAIRAAIRDVNRSLRSIYRGEIIPVSMPLIGAKLGGGDWTIISAIIEEESTDFQPVVYTLDGIVPGHMGAD